MNKRLLNPIVEINSKTKNLDANAIIVLTFFSHQKKKKRAITKVIENYTIGMDVVSSIEG